MALFDYEQQRAAFREVRQHPSLTGRHSPLHVPEILDVAQFSDQDAFNTWRSSLITQLVGYHKRRDDEEHWESETDVPIGVIGYDQNGEVDTFYIPSDNRSTELALGCLANMDMVVATRYPGYDVNIYVDEGTKPGFDSRLSRAKNFSTLNQVTGEWAHHSKTEFFDVNSAVVEELNEDETDNLSLPSLALRASDRQIELCPQATSLYGGGADNLDLLAALPYIASARSIIRAVFDTEDFRMPVVMKHRGYMELRPIEEHVTLRRPIVNIDHIKAGELQYIQDDYRWQLGVAGEGIISGAPYFLDNPRQTEQVPEGSIVLIDDEYGMDGIQAPILAPAAAILTRGYTGTRGVFMYGAHDHFKIIGRRLAEQRPGEFVFFSVPHMNPGEEDMKEWESLKTASKVIVASNGRDVKIAKE